MKCHESPSRWRWIRVGNYQARQLGAFSIIHLRRVCTESLLLCIMNRKKKSATRPTNQRAKPINSQTNSRTSFHAVQTSFVPPASPGVRVVFFALSKSRKREENTIESKAPFQRLVSWCVARTFPEWARQGYLHRLSFQVLHSMTVQALVQPN